MNDAQMHTFHIPVLGLAFSIDTPIRVARFGISSVMSIVDDILIEKMRKKYLLRRGEAYVPISVNEEDGRAKRITAYLNLVHRIVEEQLRLLRGSAFEAGSEIVKYFEMLPDRSPAKALYLRSRRTSDADEKAALEAALRKLIIPGEIDVNIMTKVDRPNTAPDGSTLPQEYSDALAALRGFARSNLESSVVLSAGLNPRLFSYMGQLSEFLPDSRGQLRKRVTLKVSDYRSAYIQGKILAKKGIWISEFRIESGLNCGGHAFASDGQLLGPILELFKTQREGLIRELHELYSRALSEKGLPSPSQPLSVRITAQGGIGTASEDTFLREYYRLDGTGWGSPFLLVPEATNVDAATRTRLAEARKEDFYISDASPLGVPLNNLRDTTSEQQILRRVAEGNPGSPCTKKFLSSNTEFTTEPICTASREYQTLKIRQLEGMELGPSKLAQRIGKVTEKSCLCEDLASTPFVNENGSGRKKSRAVAVCPGPNLAYFSRLATLEEMIGHIYGRIHLPMPPDRPSIFINELRLNIEFLKSKIQGHLDSLSVMEQKYVATFTTNLRNGIAYYHSLLPKLLGETERYRETIRQDLQALEQELLSFVGQLVEA